MFYIFLRRVRSEATQENSHKGVFDCPDFGCFVSSSCEHFHCIAMRNSMLTGMNWHKTQEIEHTPGHNGHHCTECEETFSENITYTGDNPYLQVYDNKRTTNKFYGQVIL